MTPGDPIEHALGEVQRHAAGLRPRSRVHEAQDRASRHGPARPPGSIPHRSSVKSEWYFINIEILSIISDFSGPPEQVTCYEDIGLSDSLSLPWAAGSGHRG
jgi:hypothetical protein